MIKCILQRSEEDLLNTGTAMKIDESMTLKSQLCFPLYACARKVVNNYAPYLEPLGLTYTQYVTMMVLWEREEISVKDLCQELYLDSGTITPVIKKLMKDGYISKFRSENDERVVIVRITEEGMALYEKAKDIPEHVCGSMSERGCKFTPEKARELREALFTILKACGQ